MIEAAITLLLARLALRVLSFERLTWFFNRPVKLSGVSGAERARIRTEMIRAIRTAMKRLPGNTTCFPRGIAAQAMLRRRGVGTTLYYGAARLPERGLTAHVWVMDGTAGVMGHLAARRYKVLACFPRSGSEKSEVPTTQEKDNG